MKLKNRYAVMLSAGMGWVLVSNVWATGMHTGGHEHHDQSIGSAGLTTQINRVVKVDMSDDMRFSQSNIRVKKGETIRFVIRNLGKLKHEFTLGTKQGLKEHYEVMKKFPEMEHDEPNTVNVAPGMTGEVIWRFTQAGTVHFACLHPGHYDAGMKGVVTVVATK